MATNEHSTSRRALILGLAGTPFLAGTIAATISTSAEASPASREAWDGAMAAYEKAKAASDAFDAKHDRVWKAYRAAEEAVPHVTITSDDAPAFQRTLTTADWRDVNMAKHNLATAKAYGPDFAPYMEACRKLVEAADARKAECERIDARLGYGAVSDRYEALCEAMSDAAATVLTTPAPHTAALLWKLDHLFGEGDARDSEGYSASWCPEWVNAFMADARRLLPQGRA